MAEQEYNPQEMDKQADLAKGELELNLAMGSMSPEQFKLFTDWFARWYLKAGHKRLGRILVSMNKTQIVALDNPDETVPEVSSVTA